MGGLAGGFFDLIHGKGPEQIEPSGAFQGVEDVGSAYSSFLQDFLGGDFAGTERFGRISETIRDRLSDVTRTQRGRASQFAQTRGFFDSGALADMFGDIDRGETEQFTRSISELLFSMEEAGLNRIFPFLSGASQEFVNIAGLNTGNLLAERQQNLDKGTEIASLIMGGFGTGGVTGGGPQGGGGPCWVARSVYGIDDPRWLLARDYVVFMSPRPFYRFYVKYGERIAGWLDRHNWAKKFFKPFFDSMVRKASR